MQHDQGFTGSHRMPPSGDYLLRIAQAATRVTIDCIIIDPWHHYYKLFFNPFVLLKTKGRDMLCFV
jgi:hypothetical protein